ncbi:MAG: N-acetyltransferase family protein [Planctomycetota bacterium]
MQRQMMTSLPAPEQLWVRAGSQLDNEAIADIYNEYVDDGPFTMEASHWTALSVKRDIEQSTDGEGFLVCEDENGRVLGWGKVKRYSARAGYAIACEISVYVSRDARGRGVGDTLMKSMLRLAKRFGYHHVVSKIISANQPSVRFHLKHGFDLVGVQREVGVVDGQLADVTLMQHLLSQNSHQELQLAS